MPDLIAKLAADAQAVAARTGDKRAQLAADILNGKSMPGRRVIDDTEPLEYARGLLEAGFEKTEYGACLRAAKFYAPPHGVESCRRRLQRKFSDKIINPNNELN